MERRQEKNHNLVQPTNNRERHHRFYSHLDHPTTRTHLLLLSNKRLQSTHFNTSRSPLWNFLTDETFGPPNLLPFRSPAVIFALRADPSFWGFPFRLFLVLLPLFTASTNAYQQWLTCRPCSTISIETNNTVATQLLNINRFQHNITYYYIT